MSAPRIHRVTGDSKQGRRLRSQNSRREVGPGLTPEQIAWNARVEAERAAKKAKRICRNDGKPCDPYCNGGQCMTPAEAEEYAKE